MADSDELTQFPTEGKKIFRIKANFLVFTMITAMSACHLPLVKIVVIHNLSSWELFALCFSTWGLSNGTLPQAVDKQL